MGPSIADRQITDATTTVTYDDLKRELETDPEIRSGQGATSEEIQNAERALGVPFPSTYRRFLEDFGWLDGYGDRVFGLGADVPAANDLVRETLAERTEFRPYLPPHLIPLHNDGAGNLAALDTKRDGDDPPVVLWDHEFDEDQEPETEEENLIEWLAQLIAWARQRE